MTVYISLQLGWYTGLDDIICPRDAMGESIELLHMHPWNDALKVLILIFGGGLIVGKLTEKPRIPDVAAYLLLGILIGPACLNWMSEPGGSQVNQFILNLGATLIVFDGGRSVEFGILRKVWLSIGLLATVGVVVCAIAVGAVAHYALGTPWLFSLLMAAVLASTDPATLIPVFRRVPIVPRLQQTVESESAFNDATGSVLVFTLLGLYTAGHGQVSWLGPIWDFLQSSVVGLIVGVVLGLLALWLISYKGWGVFHEYGSIVLLITAMGAYIAADLLHASGFMAAFTAGVITGNGPSFGWSFSAETEDNVHHFGSAITLIFRMMIFVLLGTQVNFHVVGAYLGPGLLLVAALMFVARPLTVLSSAWPDRRVKWTWRELIFMFWVRETGVIPAALSGVLAAQGIRGADMISSVTFLAILCTILIQASSTGWVARRLGVAATGTSGDEDV